VEQIYEIFPETILNFLGGLLLENVLTKLERKILGQCRESCGTLPLNVKSGNYFLAFSF
jgi:hypothetical protein